MTPDSGASSCASASSARRARLRGCGANGIAGGPFGARVRHRQHDAHQRDAVGIAMVDAHDERAAAVVVVDEVELPHRTRRIERRGGEAATRAPAVRAGRRGRAAPCGRRGARCRNAVSVSQNAPRGVSTGRCRNRGTPGSARRSPAAGGRATAARGTAARRRSSSGSAAGPCAATRCRPRKSFRVWVSRPWSDGRAARARCARLCVRAKVA